MLTYPLRCGSPKSAACSRTRGPLAWILSACLLWSTSLAVHAQDFPNRAVHVVVPFPPGAINDGLARVMADEMSKAMGQPFVVENRPGASGALALDYVASQPADGYTMVMGGNGPSVIVPSLNPNAKYSPKDFDPVAFVAGLPSVLVVHPSVPVRTVQELISYARANGDKVNCGSHGAGSFNHLACVQFNQLTGARMTHVPYKGAAQVMTDFLAGRIQVYFAVLPTVADFIKTGQVIALATGEEKRLATLPDIPTLSEAGLPGMVVSPWIALYVRAGAPAATVQRLQVEADKILRRPDIMAYINATGSIAKPMAPAALTKLTQDEFQTFSRIAREANIRVE